MSLSCDTLIVGVDHALQESKSRGERHIQLKNEEAIEHSESRVGELTAENKSLKGEIKWLKKSNNALKNELQKKEMELVRYNTIISELEEKMAHQLKNTRKVFKDFGEMNRERNAVQKESAESSEKQRLQAVKEKKSLEYRVARLQAENVCLIQQIRNFQEHAVKNHIREKSQDDKLSTKIDAFQDDKLSTKIDTFQNESYANSMKLVEIPKAGLLESKRLSLSPTTRQISPVESFESEMDYGITYQESLIKSDGDQVQVIYMLSKESTRSVETSCMIIRRLLSSWFQVELDLMKILTNYFSEAVRYMTPFWRNFFNIGKRYCSNFYNAYWPFIYTKKILIANKVSVIVLPYLSYLFCSKLLKEDLSSDFKESLQEHELSGDSNSQCSDEMSEEAIAQFQSPICCIDSDYSENETEREKESILPKPVIKLPNIPPNCVESCEDHEDATMSAIMQKVNDSQPISFFVPYWEKIQAWNIFGKDKRQTYRHLLNLTDKPQVMPTMFEIFVHISLYALLYIYFADKHGQIDHISLYFPKTNHGYSYGWSRQLPISEVLAAKLDGWMLQAVELVGVEVKSFPLPG